MPSFKIFYQVEIVIFYLWIMGAKQNVDKQNATIDKSESGICESI